jgi:putative ABC transport system ATP-binding protein
LIDIDYLDAAGAIQEQEDYIMIKLNKINKIYKVGGEDFYALKNIDLEISSGDFIAICGASGSGKTTLLNIIGCLDDASSGTYLFEKDGVSFDVIGLSNAKKATMRNEQIGFVLQDFALINTQSVLYNVELPLLYSKVPYARIKDIALEALGKVGLKDHAKKNANQLSGGQRQRVAIARALVNNPSIILADEPTGQLDSATGLQIMGLLKDLNEQGVTVVVVTHDKNVAAMAKQVMYMKDGILLPEA